MMLRPLTKTFTAGLLAVSMALTGLSVSATPAAANGHRNNQGAEAAAVFGGLLLLYGLSQANRTDGTRRNTPPAVHQPRPQPQPIQRVAPGRCFIEGFDGNQRFRGYRYRCMQQFAGHSNLLPQNCLRQIRTNRGQRAIYGARCLSNNGWTRG